MWTEWTERTEWDDVDRVDGVDDKDTREWKAPRGESEGPGRNRLVVQQSFVGLRSAAGPSTVDNHVRGLISSASSR